MKHDTIPPPSLYRTLTSVTVLCGNGWFNQFYHFLHPDFRRANDLFYLVFLIISKNILLVKTGSPEKK
jgi:hypothetical protein